MRFHAQSVMVGLGPSLREAICAQMPPQAPLGPVTRAKRAVPRLTPLRGLTRPNWGHGPPRTLARTHLFAAQDAGRREALHHKSRGTIVACVPPRSDAPLCCEVEQRRTSPPEPLGPESSATRTGPFRRREGGALPGVPVRFAHSTSPPAALQIPTRRPVRAACFLTRNNVALHYCL